jgi:para-nitrobenzyl esterase
MRSLLLAATMVAISAPAAYAQAAPKFSTATSTINDLVANPEAKAVLQKHMAPIVDMAGQIGTQTLKGLQAMAGDQIPDSLLAAIDADLAKIK